MKKLKRMLLIHWHNYEKEVISFEMINFITGKTAAGKSTIIDALQLILLGDTSGNFFNKAANQKSERTLKSYLFGERGDDGDTGFRYLRNERFSSYVALEFEDTERKKDFTAGIVCDCYKDQTFDYKWFLIHNQGFPENLFIDEETKIPYDIGGLRIFFSQWLGSRKGSEYEFFDVNKQYQNATLGKFGQIKEKYRTLLKKAVPFTPISDIERFITDSICDVKNNIQIDQMQSDILQYKRLEADAKRTEIRIERLKKISTVNEEYEGEKEKFRQQNYIVKRAAKESRTAVYQGCLEQAKELRELIEKKRLEIEHIKEEIKKTGDELESLKDVYRSSDLAQRERNLKKEIYDLNEKIDALRKNLRETVSRINRFGTAWAAHQEKVEKAGLSSDAKASELFRLMEELKEKEACHFDFMNASLEMKTYKQKIGVFCGNLRYRCDQIQSAAEELRAVVENLKKGIKPYPSEVTTLKHTLEEAFYDRYKKPVQVEVLADLLEIPEEKWRNAIEGYLDRQKFYLLVPEEYYQEALSIYNREKAGKNLHSAGIVDIGKLRRNFNKPPKEGSLAEEIQTSHKDARLYADYLLGGVMKCSRTEDLNQYKISITTEGMLYKGYVTRAINPARYATPFIGKRSMEVLLQNKETELFRQEKLYEETMCKYETVHSASGQEILEEYEAEHRGKMTEAALEIPDLEESLAETEKEYNSLDLTYLERMKGQIKDLSRKLDEQTDEKDQLNKICTQSETNLLGLENEKIPTVKGEIDAAQSEIDETFDAEWIETVGESRFLKEAASRSNSEKSLAERFFSAMRQSEIRQNRLRNERTQLRAEYNKEYNMPFDVALESNKDFDKELDTLAEILLPDYINKIVDARKKAYDQFRDDFIAKLKSNIESVSRQIEELNQALRQHTFGTDKYRFVKSPKQDTRDFYNMIMDPLLMDTGGWNMTSQSFVQKYQKEIDEMFRMLILEQETVSAKERAEYEKNVKKYTDYRTYLFFDLIVTDEDGEEQRLSKTLLKKSGGETQIPFYIALLASFSQICRINSKNQNNTIRIIILDEAFSKMDGERIRESIMLLRRFQLQAIFSAPPEKISDIAPLVDRNIAVYKDSRYSFAKHFDPKEVEALDGLSEMDS